MNRRRIALALTILWVVGFELMPWLHIALHDHLPHHHHDANGADVIDDDHDAEVDEHAADRIAPHDDDLDGEVDEHAGDRVASHDDDLDAEVDEHGVPVHVHVDIDVASTATRDAEQALLSALAHGQHSFAHHGIAVPVPAPAITMPLPIDRRPITLAMAEQPAWVSASVPDASARGPPALLV